MAAMSTLHQPSNNWPSVDILDRPRVQWYSEDIQPFTYVQKHHKEDSKIKNFFE